MGTVIGPINGLDWRTMRLMRQTIKFLMAEGDPEKADAIDRAKKIYADIRDPYTNKAA